MGRGDVHPVQQVRAGVPARSGAREGVRRRGAGSGAAGVRVSTSRLAELGDSRYTVQVSPDHCTGCELCVEICPARDKATGVKALYMQPLGPLSERERQNYAFFLTIPEPKRDAIAHGTVEGSQLLQPLFEYSSACPGCGETPYLKLATQLFGDRMIVANAIGCSSIFGGSLPTSPWACNDEGRGPAWASSLCEDNAEFGYGMRLTIDAHIEQARALLRGLDPVVGSALGAELLGARQDDESEIHDQRLRVEMLKKRLRAWLAAATEPASDLVAAAWRLLAVADNLVKKSVWIVGGDAWAYDAGYGGLDHVLASDRDVNVLVLDTGGYGDANRKDLAQRAMACGHVYVARVALGANDTQTVRAFLEAESYPGPSLLIAYAHCIDHGIAMKDGLAHQGRAVASGRWPLVRFDPRAAGDGRPPLTLDSASSQ